MRRHEIRFRLLLRDAAADAVIRTLDRLGGTRSGQDPWWFLPSLADKRVRVELRVGSGEAGRRLALGMTIAQFLIDVDASFEDSWADALSRGLNIPAAVAHRLIAEAAAWLFLTSSHRESALGLLPTLIETLLTEHEGIALSGYRAWTSDDCRNGQLEGLAHWPFLSITEEFGLSQAVLVGKVVSQGELTNELRHPEGRRSVLRVEETLRAQLPPTVEVHGGVDFPLVIGKRYLLFLNSTHGRFSFSPFGNSEALPAAADTLSVVRDLATSRKADIE